MAVVLGDFVRGPVRAGGFLEQFFYDLDIVISPSVHCRRGRCHSVLCPDLSRNVLLRFYRFLGSWISRIGREGVDRRVAIRARRHLL